MEHATVTIAGRYNGPPDSANGGYVCGILGAELAEPSVVRLRVPPPLNVPLVLEHTENGAVLRDGDTVVAEGRLADIDVDVPTPPTFEEAQTASKSYRGFEEHIFSTCFVCGPSREPGDGLRVFAGPVTGRDLVASPWVPDASLGDGDGCVPTEIVWAALDCPGAFSFPQVQNRACVLGEMGLRLERAARVGEPHIVTAWYLGSEGRKHYAAVALHTAVGERCAVARQTWIETVPANSRPIS